MGIIFGRKYNLTAEQVSNGRDLTNKTYLITGANNGIGLEAARVLYKRNANVILASRNENKNQEAIAMIQKSVPNSKGSLRSMILNLSSLKSVRDFVSDFGKLGIPLHCLICNAGIMAPPLEYTEDGYESQFAVNHLAHFLLTYLLTPYLHQAGVESGQKARVVFLSSRAHNNGHIDFNDLNWKNKQYRPFKAYGQSKLANLLTAAEMNRRFQQQNKEIQAFSVHPGVIPTGLTRSNWKLALFYTFMHLFLKSIPQGAATTVYCATSPDLDKDGKGGKYYADCDVASPLIPEASNADVAAKLFDESAKLLDLSLNFP